MKHTHRILGTLLMATTLLLAFSCKSKTPECPIITDTFLCEEQNVSTVGIIDFETMEEDLQTGFKGGEGDVAFRIFKDDLNKVMRVRMTPHSSVGQHSHTSDSEIIMVLKGTAKIIFDGQELLLHEGQIHYCPKGHGHTIINPTDEEVHLCCVVPQQ